MVNAIPTSEPVRIGILGAGLQARNTHIPNWLRVNNAKLVAICDKDEKVAKTAAQQFSIEYYHTDLSDMLRKQELDLIDICTPAQVHGSHAVQVMKEGYHAVVEKPIAQNLKEADEMIRISKQYGVQLFVIHNTLFSPGIMKAKSMIENGELGDLTSVHVSYLGNRNSDWMLDRNHWTHKLRGGILEEALPHPIYILQGFLGKLNVRAVQARKLCNFEWVLADELQVLLNGKNGVGLIHISYNLSGNLTRMDIHGTLSNMYVDIQTGIAEKYASRHGTNAFSLALDNLRTSLSRVKSVASVTTQYLVNRPRSGHSILFPNFVNCIRGIEEPLVKLDKAREVVRISEKICDCIAREKSD